MIKQLSSTLHSLFKINKKYHTSQYSTLYIPYNQTSNTYVIVEPYVDLEERLKDIKILKNNITLRGLHKINIDKIYDNWSNFISMRDELIDLNFNKIKLTEQLKKIKNDNDEIDKLKKKQITNYDKITYIKRAYFFT